jgi:glycosyltransferase involved in cell wall biosynthesis
VNDQTPDVLDIKPIPLPPLPDRPLVSVLIPNYNYGHLIEEAVASVLRQTYQRFEIVICDDGSTDNSRSVIEDLAAHEHRIHAIFKPNGGVSSALNAAFTVSKGEIIALLDADDVWWPERLDKVVQAFHSCINPGMVVHPLRAIELESGKVIKSRVPRCPDGGWLAPRLVKGEYCIFPPASGLSFRREIAIRVFPLPEDFRTLADGILRERVALLTPVEIVDEVLGVYRQHISNVTGFYGQIEKHIAITRAIITARASFIRSVYGLHLDPLKWIYEPYGWWMKELALAERILRGERIHPLQAIQWTQGKRRIIWTTLSLLPLDWGQKLLRWWWEDNGTLKRIARTVFHFSP